MPSGEQRDGQEILDLPVPQLLDCRIVGRTFDAAVPAAIVVGAVAVVLAVRFIVLLVVGDEIVEREAIVAGDEVDALLGFALACGRRSRDCPPVRSATGRNDPGIAAEEVCAHRRESGRSILSRRRRQSCRPDTARPRPMLRQSAWFPPVPDPTRYPTAPADSAAGDPTASRERIDARSKRKPSTCISCTQ